MAKQKDRPGVMFYFDKWEDIKQEDDHVCAKFFRAAMDYAQYGVLPDFTGGYKLAWGLIQTEIDKDADRYDNISLSRKYSRWCGVERTAGREPLSFDEWKQMLSNVDERDERQRTRPTTTTTSTTATATTTTTTSTINNKNNHDEFYIKIDKSYIRDDELAGLFDGNENDERQHVYTNVDERDEQEHDTSFEDKRRAAMEMLLTYGNASNKNLL